MSRINCFTLHGNLTLNRHWTKANHSFLQDKWAASWRWTPEHSVKHFIINQTLLHCGAENQQADRCSVGSGWATHLRQLLVEKTLPSPNTEQNTDGDEEKLMLWACGIWLCSSTKHLHKLLPILTWMASCWVQEAWLRAATLCTAMQRHSDNKHNSQSEDPGLFSVQLKVTVNIWLYRRWWHHTGKQLQIEGRKWK